MFPRKNLWNRLEEIKFPLELRVATKRMYDNIISKFKNIKSWSKEINCNIGVKQGCPLSPTLFGIYIDCNIPRMNPIVNVNTNACKLVRCFDIIFVCTFHGIVCTHTAQ
jgi:hypothetical protein